MEYKNLIVEALNEFPEFLEEYSKISDEQNSLISKPIHLHEFHMQVCERIMHNNPTPSIYQFYEDVIRYHFIKLIDVYNIDEGNEATIEKITKMVEFFEKMALSGDVDVENVLLIGIFEGIIDDKNKLKTILTLLKEKSRLLLYKLQNYHDVNFSE